MREPNPNLDAYMEDEIARQSPSDRLRTKLGFNSFDNSKFDQAYAESKLKDRSTVLCQWCSNPMVTKNVREKCHLCPLCNDGRANIEAYITSHKIIKLTEADARSIVSSKTKSVGPFTYGRNKPK